MTYSSLSSLILEQALGLAITYLGPRTARDTTKRSIWIVIECFPAWKDFEKTA